MSKPELALFEPDIPYNSAACMRLVACLDTRLHLIEPCGFVFDPKKMRRIGMDYAEQARVERHLDWQNFLKYAGYGACEQAARPKKRLLLATTKGSLLYQDFRFQSDDILIMGRESSGVPQSVHEQITQRIMIPMNKQARSLNVAISAAILLSEALRQTESLPEI